MRNIPFVKATACGNDFILIEAQHVRPGEMAESTRRICDRHLGVGADGVEWLLESEDADATARLMNSDGSDAEVSGNGTRCVAAWVVHQQGKSEVRVRTDAGVKTCTLIRRDGMKFEFKTRMGEPQVGDPFSIKVAFGEVTGIPLSMGNPQFVVFVDKFHPGWQAEAAEIGRHHDFKYGTNVELVKVNEAMEIEIRIFERGAGETLSSGTGSCAAAVASIFTKRAKSPVRVISPGGTQTVEWDREVVLYGPAEIICQGEFYL